MDWKQLIDQFSPIGGSDVMLFAPPREMELAINTYNRAIFNLNHDSSDIALIALRKLVATYPMFAQAAFLLGCCQASLGQIDEALEQIDHAVLAGLPEALHEKALAAQVELKHQHELAALAAQTAGSGSNRPLIGRSGSESRSVQAGVVLEKTRRGGKVRMASEKERQSVLRRGEFPENEETNISVAREPIEYLRLAIPALAILIVAGLLIFAGVRWLPGLVRQNQERRQAAVRLEWLLDHLDILAGQDKTIDNLLAEYQDAFNPTPTPASTAASGSETTAAGQTGQTTMATDTSTQTSVTAAETTPVQTTTLATTTEAVETTAVETTAATGTTATTLGSDVETLQQANQHYQLAIAGLDADLLAAADRLLNARALLADIPAGTTAPDVTGDAGKLSAAVENQISSIGKNAAELNRELGMDLFNKQQYQDALVYFLKAFQLYPRSYGGGAAYYCGRCYQLLDDGAAAKPYYDYVIRTFSGRDIARSAEARLAEMGY